MFVKEIHKELHTSVHFPHSKKAHSVSELSALGHFSSSLSLFLHNLGELQNLFTYNL